MSNPIISLVQFSGKRDGAALSALAIGEGFRRHGCKLQMIFGTDGEVFDLSLQRGYETHLWEHKNWLRDQRLVGFVKNYYQESRRAKELLNLFLKSKTDLVYINTVASLGAARAASLGHLPCIWHFREQFQEHGGELKAPVLIKPLLPLLWSRFTKAFIFNTQAAKKSMYGNRIGGKVIPVGISDTFGQELPDRDVCRNQFNLPFNATVIGIPGGLRKVKGHDWFFNSTSDWLKANPHRHVALAGTGSDAMTQFLTQMVSDLGLTERVHFLGSVKNMPLFYRACDLICIPSKGESFGRCAVEAMACRVPVVASGVGGLKDLIQHGQNGMLVPYNDGRGLVSILNEMLRNTDHVSQMVDHAHRDFSCKYTESVYQEAICSHALHVWQQSRP
jgi:glycosyltransferase involved in cell wall biosynthesis